MHRRTGVRRDLFIHYRCIYNTWFTAIDVSPRLLFSLCLLASSKFPSLSILKSTVTIRICFQRCIMYFKSAYILQALALSITLSLSSPLSANSKRQDLTLDDCASNRTTPDRRCWQLAGVPKYLTNQTTGWIKTTPVCEDRTRCCGPSEVWSACFLRLATGQDQDCTVLGDGQCARTNQLDPNLGSSIRTQVKYIVLAIYGIHDYYTAWYSSKSQWPLITCAMR